MTPRLTAETILLCACENIGVTIEGMVVVGRRWAVDSTNPSSRALGSGVHRRRPQGLQGQSRPLWPQWAAAWPLVPCSRTLERPTLESVRSF